MAMVLNNIEELIEKYNNAETTLKEEAQLKAYFANDNVEPHLEHYKPLFHYFSLSQKEQYTKDVPLTTKKTKLYQWISVAAVAVLMLGLVVPSFVGPSEQEKQEAKQQLNSLVLVSDNLNQGIEGAGRLSEFSKTTNKIFKNK